MDASIEERHVLLFTRCARCQWRGTAMIRLRLVPRFVCVGGSDSFDFQSWKLAFVCVDNIQSMPPNIPIPTRFDAAHARDLSNFDPHVPVIGVHAHHTSTPVSFSLKRQFNHARTHAPDAHTSCKTNSIADQPGSTKAKVIQSCTCPPTHA